MQSCVRGAVIRVHHTHVTPASSQQPCRPAIGRHPMTWHRLWRGNNVKGIRLFAVAALLAAACTAMIAPAAAQQPRVLKFASIQAATQPSSKAMERMAQLVAERTNGA